MRKAILSARLIRGQKPVVYLKSDNILGHKAGTKANLYDFNGSRFSLNINGQWHGYYSESVFETTFSKLIKEYAGLTVVIVSIITSYFMI